MTKDVIVKTQETREGVTFRVFKEGEYKFFTLPFNNYFYIKTKEYEIFKDEFHAKFTFCIHKCEPDGKFTRIYLSNNFMRHKVRMWWEERTSTYEADIKANKRFLLDNPNFKLHNEDIPYAFFDIETDDRLPLQKDDRGDVVAQSRILSFALVDHKGEVMSEILPEETDEAEIMLLHKILKHFSNYGVISGWFSEKFDMPYIKQRCDKYGISYQLLDYINHIDYLPLYKKYTRKSLASYSLNSVSNAELGESKIDQAKGNGAIYNTWKENNVQLERYNIEDSNLIYKMNKNIQFIEVSMNRANNAGCHVRATMNNSDSGDFLLMRRSVALNIIQPSKPTKDQMHERMQRGKISGGFTRALEKGFFPEVDVWDYASFYPSVIMTYNISPETFVESIYDSSLIPDLLEKGYYVTPSNFNVEQNRQAPHRVYKKDEGVVPSVCKLLLAKRNEIKYTMKEFKKTDPIKYRKLFLEQYALKTDGNSIYGILSFPYSRWYMWDVGDTVTTCCQATIKESYKCIERWGGTVIGGDTDSTFALLNGKDWEEIDKKFIEYWDEWHKQWGVAEHHKIIFEHEKKVKNMFFILMKNYAYLDEDELVIKGLECIKADANPLAAKLQRKFIEDVCFEKYDENEWEKIISDTHEKVFDQEMTVAELTMNKSLTKMPKDYEGFVIDSKTGEPKVKRDGTLQKKSILAHVKLAKRLMDAGVDLYPGSKIHYIVVKDKPIIAITPEEYQKGYGHFEHKNKKGPYEFEFTGLYDSKYYWKRVLRPIVKVIYAYYKKLPEWSWNCTDTEKKKMLAKLYTEEEE